MPTPTLPRVYVAPAEFPKNSTPLLRIVRLIEGEEIEDHEDILAAIGDTIDAMTAADKYVAYLQDVKGDFVEVFSDTDKGVNYTGVTRNTGDNCVKFFFGPFKRVESAPQLTPVTSITNDDKARIIDLSPAPASSPTLQMADAILEAAGWVSTDRGWVVPEAWQVESFFTKFGTGLNYGRIAAMNISLRMLTVATSLKS